MDADAMPGSSPSGAPATDDVPTAGVAEALAEVKREEGARAFPRNGPVTAGPGAEVTAHYFAIDPMTDPLCITLLKKFTRNQWVLLTGAPCQGKTSLCHRLAGTHTLNYNGAPVTFHGIYSCVDSRITRQGDWKGMMNQLLQQSQHARNAGITHVASLVTKLRAGVRIMWMIDDFDQLQQCKYDVVDRFLGQLRGWRQLSSQLHLVGVGSSAVGHLAVRNGSPFNVVTKVQATGFAVGQVKELLQSAVDMRQLPETATDLAEPIVVATGGMRGRVCRIAEAMRTTKSGEFDLDVYLRRMPTMVMDDSLGRTVLSRVQHFVESGAGHGKVMDNVLRSFVIDGSARRNSAKQNTAIDILEEAGLVARLPDDATIMNVASPLCREVLRLLAAAVAR